MEQKSKITKKNPIGLVVESKEAAFWIITKRETEHKLKQLTDTLKFEQAVYSMIKLELAKVRAKEKKRKV